ncbi:MAG TPA: type II secretion system protein GspC [Candidatus Acidoferrum sp.]|nr:type II secretion system protein GspC [Candidatus Acidoferrum sp.]
MGMDVYIKKYFWMVGAAAVVLCSALAASAVGHIIEATALADSDKPARRPVAHPPLVSPIAEQDRGPSKSGTPLAERNIFCSTCLPPEPAAAETAAAPIDPNNPPITSLPLRLVATNVSTDEMNSFATILNTSTEKQGAYWVGNEIPGAGPVNRILGKYVDFENRATGHVERVSLLSGEVPRPSSTVSFAPPVETEVDPRAARDELLAAVEAGVRKIDDSTYEVDRALVEKVLSNPTAVSRGARIVPSVKNGQPNGFKLYAIRPSSVYAKIGLMNGDTLHAVNGFELNSMDKALEVYTKVRESSSLSVSITRRGKPVTLNYTIK